MGPNIFDMSFDNKTADLLIKVDNEYIRVHKAALAKIPYIKSALSFQENTMAPAKLSPDSIIYETGNIGRAVTYLNYHLLISTDESQPADVVDLSRFSMAVVNCCLNYFYYGKITPVMFRRIGFDGWCELLHLLKFLAVDDEIFRHFSVIPKGLPRPENEVELAQRLFQLDHSLGGTYFVTSAAMTIADKNLNVDWLIDCFRPLPSVYLIKLIAYMRSYVLKMRAMHQNVATPDIIRTQERRIFMYIVATAFTRTPEQPIGNLMDYYPIEDYTDDDFDRAYTGCAHYKFIMPIDDMKM